MNTRVNWLSTVKDRPGFSVDALQAEGVRQMNGARPGPCGRLGDEGNAAPGSKSWCPAEAASTSAGWKGAPGHNS